MCSGLLQQENLKGKRGATTRKGACARSYVASRRFPQAAVLWRGVAAAVAQGWEGLGRKSLWMRLDSGGGWGAPAKLRRREVLAPGTVCRAGARG